MTEQSAPDGYREGTTAAPLAALWRTNVAVNRQALTLANEFRKVVKGEVRFDPFTRALYSTDASIYQMEPVGLVVPQDEEDVAATVRLAHQTRTPVLPRGGGTSLAGQCVNHAIVMDMSKAMAKVLEINREERWARVQPGIAIDDLNATLGPLDLRFAPDPSTANRATIGGAIGNNSCGSHSILYGKTVDHVLELKVVLSDGAIATIKPLSGGELAARQSLAGVEGEVYRNAVPLAQRHQQEIERRFPKIPRRVSGYNLDELLKSPVNFPGLLVGSEGTLATIVEAKVNLVHRYRHAVLAVFHFRSLIEAMEGAVWLLQQGERLATIELIDNVLLAQAKTQLSLARRLHFVQGEPAALLAVELDGDDLAALTESLDRLTERAERSRIGYARVKLLDPAAQQDVWAVRRAGVGLAMGIKGDAKPLPFVEDTAVPTERLPEYVRRFDELVRANGTTAVYYGHASVGCLHIRPLVNLKLQEGLDRMVSIATQVADLVLEFGGSLSGEHGDGIVRGVFTEKMFGPTLYQAFRDLKRTFDPLGIMNPGKIIDCPPMTENLRASPRTIVQPVAAKLDFSADGGFYGAVEQCNGQGACRKTLDGAMCPSFMVTREEEHSTRGRANALRAVLTGALPASDFTSHRMFQALDLCLECKACKAECPSNVDMAKLKYEFLDHYYRANGYPLRARLFANIAALNRLGCATAPLSNWLLASPLGRKSLELAGIHPARRLPTFARPTFRTWFRRRDKRAEAGGDRPRAALLVDTFMEYNEPSVGVAATALLERAGFQVLAPQRPCCGRPMLGKGMVEQARRYARRNVDALYPLAAAGIPIVGCEPSCTLMYRDEYLDLLPGDERARAVSKSVVLLDEFLARLPEDARNRLAFRRTEQKVLFHGHCHQKALVGSELSLAALRMVPGAQVSIAGGQDAGCCGMAGTFGFEKEHYELSMKIAERRLLPAVTKDPDATVVVMGISCRQQVEHGANVRPLHLAEFLANSLASP